jgi:hypothetical protein
MTTTIEKPAHVPDKFWDASTNTIRTDALVNSYNSLEKKLSSTLPTPDNDDNKKKVHKALGLPDTADEYCIDCSHGLFEPDNDINHRLHAKGLNQEQVQEVYDLAAEKIVPMIAELAADFQADREVEKLINHFGGTQQWKSVSKQIYAFAKNNVTPDVLEALSGSFEGVIALHRMMKNKEPSLQKSNTAITGRMDETDLQSMMRDPKYWRDKDPATVKKVTEGFQGLYN